MIMKPKFLGFGFPVGGLGLIKGRFCCGDCSVLLKGIIDYLVGSSLDAKMVWRWLQPRHIYECSDNFVFKIVPMLNPEVVINGNYR